MKITLLRGILLLFSATFCFVTATTTSETIEVNFKTTCSSSIELQFNRAVSLLHRFRFVVSSWNWFSDWINRTEDARIAFSDIVKTDPDCAIAYWGLAMTCWSQTKFFPPTPAAHKEGTRSPPITNWGNSGSGFIDEAYVVGKKHGKLNLLEKVDCSFWNLSHFCSIWFGRCILITLQNINLEKDMHNTMKEWTCILQEWRKRMKLNENQSKCGPSMPSPYCLVKYISQRFYELPELLDVSFLNNDSCKSDSFVRYGMQEETKQKSTLLLISVRKSSRSHQVLLLFTHYSILT